MCGADFRYGARGKVGDFSLSSPFLSPATSVETFLCSTARGGLENHSFYFFAGEKLNLNQRE